jgi:hypothetical protein
MLVRGVDNACLGAPERLVFILSGDRRMQIIRQIPDIEREAHIKVFRAVFAILA